MQGAGIAGPHFTSRVLDAFLHLMSPLSSEDEKIQRKHSDQDRKLKVFLTYAHNDYDEVKSIYEKLASDGVDVWLDREKLLPGEDWSFEIGKEIQNSDVVIVLMSKASVSKEGYVQKEIRVALDRADEKAEGTIFVIPARLEECDMPRSLSRVQWVDLYEPDGYSLLMRSLKARADRLEIKM